MKNAPTGNCPKAGWMKAKAKVQAEIGDGMVRYDFTNYRVRRCLWLDGEPRCPTKSELIEHGFTEYAEGMPDA